jgi:hypothetical protein
LRAWKSGETRRQLESTVAAMGRIYPDTKAALRRSPCGPYRP